jgi:hypothetical protein
MSLDIEAGGVNNYLEKTTNFSNCVRNGGARTACEGQSNEGMREQLVGWCLADLAPWI